MLETRKIKWQGYDINLVVMGSHAVFRMEGRSCVFSPDDRDTAKDILNILEEQFSNMGLQEMIEDNIAVGGETAIAFSHAGKRMLIPFVFKTNEIVVKTIIIKSANKTLVATDPISFSCEEGNWVLKKSS